MTVHENGHRFKKYVVWETKLHQPYNYEKDGLLKHLLSHKITESQNPVVRIILQYYEKTIIYLLKYVDILKNFKNPNAYNR